MTFSMRMPAMVVPLLRAGREAADQVAFEKQVDEHDRQGDEDARRRRSRSSRVTYSPFIVVMPRLAVQLVWALVRKVRA